MNVLELLKESGALLEGHFLLSSGKHSPYYVQCAKLFENPEIGNEVGKLLAEKVKSWDIDVVAGPAMGGVILAYVVAAALKKRNVFFEREEGKMRLRRSFRIEEGEKVLVVEDVVTTGKSVREVMEEIERMGGKVAGVASIVNRSGKESPFDVPYTYLVKLDFPVYEPENCPLCEKKIPLEKPGSRYLRK